MIDHLTLRICTASSGAVARVFAAVEYAGLVVVTVVVFPAANYAVPTQTDFLVETVAVVQAALDAVAVDAQLPNCTFLSGCAGRSTATFLAHHGRGARPVVLAECWNPLASLHLIVGLASEAVRAEAGRAMFLHPADCIRSAGVPYAAGTLAHGRTSTVGDAGCRRRAVGVSVGAFVGVATSWGSTGVSNVLLGRALAHGPAKLVATDGRRVARVLLEAVVDQLAPGHGVPFVALATSTDGRVVLGFAHGIGTAAAPHHAGVDTLVLVAYPVGEAVFVLEAVGFNAAQPLVDGVSDVARLALADGAVSVGRADGVPTAQHGFAGICARVVPPVARPADLVGRTVRVAEAPVDRLAVSGDAAELVGTVAARPADLSTSPVFADFVASALTVGPTVHSAQALVAELSNRAAIIGGARNVLDAAGARIAVVTVPAPADGLVTLRIADGVDAAFCVALTGIVTLVPNAHLGVATFFVSGTFHELATVFGIARVSRSTGTDGPVVDGAAVGVDAARRRVLARVSAVRRSGHVDARRSWRAVVVSLVAYVWVVASDRSLLSVSVAHEAGGAPARVAARVVLADGSVVARMLLALVSIDASEPSTVLVARDALAVRLAILDRARSVGPTLHPGARTLADKVDAFFILRAVRVVQAVDSYAAPVPVVRVSGEQPVLGTAALPLVVDDGADTIGSARLFARIDAFRHSVGVAGRIEGTVYVSARALSRIRAARESVADKAFRAAAQKASNRVLALAGLVARTILTFVNVFASVVDGSEARLARAAVQRAQLMHLAVAIRATTDLAVTVDAELSGRALTVSRTRGHAEVVDASFADDAPATRGPTAALDARQALGAGARARDDRALASDDRSRVSGETFGAVALRIVAADLADGVWAAQPPDFARVLAAILRAGLVQPAVGVLSAADLAVARVQARFLRRTIGVRVAGPNATAVDTLLSRGTVGVSRAHETTLLVDAGVGRGTVVIREAGDGLAAAPQGGVAAEVRLALARRRVAFRAAQGVGSALEAIAGVLAHGLPPFVRVARQVTGAVSVPVRTRVRVSAALPVRVADEAVLADALVAARRVHASGRRVAGIRVAVVDLLATDEGIARVARSTVANSLVVLSDAGRVNTAAVHARIFAVEVRKAGLSDVAVFILQAFDLLASVALVVGVADVETIGTSALGQVVVHDAHGTRRTLEELAPILASSFAVRFVKLADLVAVDTVGVAYTFGLGDLSASVSAVGIASVALSAGAPTPMVEGDAVGIRGAAEADADLRTLHHAHSVWNASGRRGATGVVQTLVPFGFDAGELVSLVPHKSVVALALVSVLPGDADGVGAALVKLARIETSLAARVVRAAHVGASPTVLVLLAFVLGSAAVDGIVWVSLEVLKAVARGLVIKSPTDGVRSALFGRAGIGTLSTANADLVRRAAVVRSAAHDGRLRRCASGARLVGVALRPGGTGAAGLVVQSDAECI